MQKFYVILSGNGYNDLQRAMSRKKNWVELPAKQAFAGRCNFIWKPVNFDYQQYCLIDKYHHQALLAQQKANLKRHQFQYGLPSEEHAQDFNPSQELIVSHLANNREITTKTGLIRCLK